MPRLPARSQCDGYFVGGHGSVAFLQRADRFLIAIGAPFIVGVPVEISHFLIENEEKEFGVLFRGCTSDYLQLVHHRLIRIDYGIDGQRR